MKNSNTLLKLIKDCSFKENCISNQILVGISHRYVLLACTYLPYAFISRKIGQNFEQTFLFHVIYKFDDSKEKIFHITLRQLIDSIPFLHIKK